MTQAIIFLFHLELLPSPVDTGKSNIFNRVNKEKVKDSDWSKSKGKILLEVGESVN